MSALSMLLHPHAAGPPAGGSNPLDSLEGLIVMVSVLLGILAFLGATLLLDWLIRRAG